MVGLVIHHLVFCHFESLGMVSTSDLSFLLSSLPIFALCVVVAGYLWGHVLPLVLSFDELTWWSETP